MVERESVTKSQKGKKADVRGKWKSVFIGRHINNVRKETHAASVMTNLLMETCAKVRDEKDDRLLPHPIRRQRLTARDKNPSKESGNKEGSSSDKGSKFHADSEFAKKQKKQKRHVSFGILRCVSIPSPKKWCTWRQMPFPTS